MDKILFISIIVLIPCIIFYLSGQYVYKNFNCYKKVNINNSMYLSLIMYKLNRMNGRQFEEFIAYLFELQGYKSELTQATADGGKDIILDDEIYVECKCYQDKSSIGTPVLQKLVGACIGDHIEKAMIVATSDITSKAWQYIKDVDYSVDIQFINKDDIFDMCLNSDKNKMLEFLGINVRELVKGSI